MWCSHCNKETTSVPTRTADGICCSQCGAAYFQEKPTEDAIRKARDIISRWSSSDLLDRISTLPEIPPLNHHQLSEAVGSDSPAAESADMSLLEPTPTAESQPGDRRQKRRVVVDFLPDDPDENLLEHHHEEPRSGLLKNDDRASEDPLEEVLPPPITADSLPSRPDANPASGEFKNSESSDLPDVRASKPSVLLKESEQAETIQRATELQARDLSEPAETATGLNSSPRPAADCASTIRDSPPTETTTQAEVTTQAETTTKAKAATEQTAGDPQPVSLSQHSQVDTVIETVTNADSPPTTVAVAEPAVTSESSSKPQRMSQSRTSQTRVSRPRKQPASAPDEGTKSMSRKFRIDTPGGERAEQPASEPKNVAGGKIQSNSKSGRRHRVDSGSPVSDTLETGDRRTRTQGRPRRRYIDEAHDSVARGPHFQVTAPRRSNFTSVTGQFLAYVGVLGLTVGTAMVIYGHFGGYSEYTPTGWLVTTVAQMMLFLGVINLVSGGMEQTNSDVSQRMEYLGSQLMRIEQVAEEALRGPKISAQRYADPDAEIAASEREQAVVED
ncbi:MAG: hypothetical protein NXI04_26000 [Planctomycetaceae bacterium]|nr:hypothetical protein [Planctomycetaceae bacterium]